MTIFQIDPIQDPRWPAFLIRHPRASIFHTREWLAALQESYGYEPFVLTTASPGADLSNGLVFCRIKSWITGRRTVSLPFSDHCEPLVETDEELGVLLNSLKGDQDASRGESIEIRPIEPLGKGVSDLQETESFCLHRLDLRPDMDDLFRGVHKDCVRRKIRRAQREDLSYEEGRSESQLARFYRLLVLTRRRQHLLPQPLAWFRNLITCMGDKVKIRLASTSGQPIASILTLRYKGTLVYKYGCSDKRFSNLGGMPLLFWRAIQEAKDEGLSQFDLGRSDWSNGGLITFKDRWGAERATLNYFRFFTTARSRVSIVPAGTDLKARIARGLVPYMSDRMLTSASSWIYRHVG